MLPKHSSQSAFLVWKADFGIIHEDGTEANILVINLRLNFLFILHSSINAVSTAVSRRFNGEGQNLTTTCHTRDTAVYLMALEEWSSEGDGRLREIVT